MDGVEFRGQVFRVPLLVVLYLAESPENQSEKCRNDTADDSNNCYSYGIGHLMEWERRNVEGTRSRTWFAGSD